MSCLELLFLTRVCVRVLEWVLPGPHTCGSLFFVEEKLLHWRRCLVCKCLAPAAGPLEQTLSSYRPLVEKKLLSVSLGHGPTSLLGAASAAQDLLSPRGGCLCFTAVFVDSHLLNFIWNAQFIKWSVGLTVLAFSNSKSSLKWIF